MELAIEQWRVVGYNSTLVFDTTSHIRQLPWIEHARRVAETGYPQAAIIAFSLISTVTKLFNRQFKSIYLPEAKASSIRLPYELVSQVARAASLACLVAAAVKGDGLWADAAVLIYTFVLGILRLANDLEWRHIALFQVNVAQFGALATLSAQVLLPCIETSSACRAPELVTGGIAALSAAIAVGALAPSEWIPPSLLYNVPVEALDAKPSLEETCGWLSYYCTYDWLTPLVWKGARKEVTMDDLPGLAWYDDPARMLEKVRWARARGKKTLWTILILMHQELIKMAIFVGSAFSVELLAPFALYNLLNYLADPSGSQIRPWLWLFLMFGGQMCRSILFQQYIFTSSRLIVRLKMAMTQELYHRAMESMELEEDPFDRSKGNSGAANGKAAGPKQKQIGTATGRLANHMSADIDSIYGARDIVMVCFGLLTGTVLASIGLYNLLGWPALVGISLLAISSPIPVYLAQRIAKAQREVRQAQDSRISLVSEYLTQIRAIKYFAWEQAVSETVDEARQSEQKYLWKVLIYFVSLNQVTQIIPYLALFAIFVTYVIVLKQPLTASTGFTTVSLIKTIRRNISMTSYLSKNVTGAMVAIDRLDRYFDATVPLVRHPEGPARIVGASFRKSSKATFQLKDISIDFVEGGFNVITGQSGSGKTTLLLSLLGEAIQESGSVTCPKDVAFASQTPWLQNESIKTNILFNSDMEEVRYQRVLDACCLHEDLKDLPQKDDTGIGENGASLSGGQKARVALARALYSKANLILLDDIFSALDAKTAASLWELCFCSDMLKDRTVVLVAQLPWVAAQADLVVTLENGTIHSSEQNLGVHRQPVAVAEILEGARTEEAPASSPPTSDPLNDPAKVAEQKPPKDDIGLEMEATGKSARLMFLRYLHYFGSVPYVVWCIATLVIGDFCVQLGNWWLSVWVDTPAREQLTNVAFYMGIYMAVSMSESLFFSAIFVSFERGSWFAARTLHRELMKAVLGAPMSWFNRIPVGRVVNRLSRDIASVDNSVSNMLRNFLISVIMLLFRISAIGFILPVFMVPASCVCFVGIVLGEMYTRVAVTVKKLVSSSQSPMFAQFGDTLAGLPVIRARADMPGLFGRLLGNKLRAWSRAAEANYNCNRWIAVRVDFLTALVSLAAGIIAVSKAGVIAAGLVGFSLMNASALSQTILGLVRSMNDLEVELQSFVRVREYTKLEPEDKEDKPYPEEGEFADDPAHVIPKNWPRSGEIEFRNVTIRYDEAGPDILTDINLKFRSGERVAVVGRTGSGKSTLVLSLLRFTHIASGTILYDGVDITKLPRRRLREGLTIIPQEPVLFSGTVRSNLDPSSAIPEEKLQSAVDSCKNIASFQYHEDEGPAQNGHTENGQNGQNGQAGQNGSAPGANGHHDAQQQRPAKGISLATPVSSKGENFSHGQRQVLSVCRALVRKSRLMLLDEATASMDYETDRAIQEVLRADLAAAGGGRGRTLVTIAHRLRTIIDYDAVVVMSAGKVLEFGSPRELYSKKGQFYDMVCHSGESDDLQSLLDQGIVDT